MLSSILRFNQLYSNNIECISLMYKLKWPAGFVCLECSHTLSYTITTRRLPLYECRNCRHQTSLTAGTIMHKSRTPLRKWLLTMYIISTCETSINAVKLAELICVSYKTAWTMLTQIRRVISDSDRSVLLAGNVEAKLEIYMKQPLPTLDRLLRERAVIIARTIVPADSSYFKIKLIKSEQEPRYRLSKIAEREFSTLHINPTKLTHLEINRRHINPYNSEALLPKIAKSAFQWMNNTFHGIGPTYSQYYLDEFCFRLNNYNDQNSNSFEYLLQLALLTSPLKQPADNPFSLRLAV